MKTLGDMLQECIGKWTWTRTTSKVAAAFAGDMPPEMRMTEYRAPNRWRRTELNLRVDGSTGSAEERDPGVKNLVVEVLQKVKERRELSEKISFSDLEATFRAKLQELKKSRQADVDASEREEQRLSEQAKNGHITWAQP